MKYKISFSHSNSMSFSLPRRSTEFSIDNYLQNNSIIVLHDNNKSRDFIVDSIKYISDKAAAKGFEFGVPEECLK